MGYEAKVILDSVSRGHRLTTLQITFPRIILSEANTHRALSKNSASSRAIPVNKRIASIEADPFVPEAFGANKPGMQDAGAMGESENLQARGIWLDACLAAVESARALSELGVHKHWANRLIEPFSWHTVVISGTEWSNYDALRDHAAAAPEIRRVTQLMKEARARSTPRELRDGEWHLPYVQREDVPGKGRYLPEEEAEVANATAKALGVGAMKVLRMVSTGRCAAVSFERQETTDFDKAVDIYGKMKSGGHMSPLEHPARPMTAQEYHELFCQPELEWVEELDAWKQVGDLHYCGNFQGWVQDRKMVPGEHDFSRVSKATL